jgi:hypothetical protein
MGLPIVRHLPRPVRQNFIRQAFDMDPGQNQKSTVVDDPL